MYGLPEDFDASSWVGKSLELVCFAKYTVSFHFSGNLRVTVESNFSYQKSGTYSTPKPVHLPVVQSPLMELIGHNISGVANEGDGTLRIEFDNGEILRCYDPPGPYESYNIEDAGKLTIV